MNKSLLELAKEAYKEDRVSEFPTWTPNDLSEALLDDFENVFRIYARMIAKECSTICETASIPIDIEIWENSTKKEMTTIMALELAKLIKKRFGVE